MQKVFLIVLTTLLIPSLIFGQLSTFNTDVVRNNAVLTDVMTNATGDEIHPNHEWYFEKIKCYTQYGDDIYIGTGDYGHIWKIPSYATVSNSDEIYEVGPLYPANNKGADKLSVTSLIKYGNKLIGTTTNKPTFFYSENPDIMSQYNLDLYHVELKSAGIEIINKPTLYTDAGTGEVRIFYPTYSTDKNYYVFLMLDPTNIQSQDGLQIVKFPRNESDIQYIRTIAVYENQSYPYLICGITGVDKLVKIDINSLLSSTDDVIYATPTAVYTSFNGITGCTKNIAQLPNNRVALFHGVKNNIRTFAIMNTHNGQIENEEDVSQVATAIPDRYQFVYPYCTPQIKNEYSIYCAEYKVAVTDDICFLDTEIEDITIPGNYIGGPQISEFGTGFVGNIKGSLREKKTIYKVNKVSNIGQIIELSPNLNGENGLYGGETIMGFDVDSDRIFGGAHLINYAFIKKQADNNGWYYQNILEDFDASQIDRAIIDDNNNVFYGMYTGPTFGYKNYNYSTDYDELIDQHPTYGSTLETLIGDKNQVRIFAIAEDDGYVVFGTRSQFATYNGNSHPNLFLYDNNTGELFNLGKIDVNNVANITGLAIKHLQNTSSGNKLYIYGTTLSVDIKFGVLFKEIDLDDLPDLGSPIQHFTYTHSSESKYGIVSLTIYNDRLYGALRKNGGLLDLVRFDTNLPPGVAYMTDSHFIDQTNIYNSWIDWVELRGGNKISNKNGLVLHFYKHPKNNGVSTNYIDQIYWIKVSSTTGAITSYKKKIYEYEANALYPNLDVHGFANEKISHIAVDDYYTDQVRIYLGYKTGFMKKLFFDPNQLPDEIMPIGTDKKGIEEFTTKLHQNHPNPFNPVTNIKFSLANSSVVTVNLYNVLGEKVAVLVNNSFEKGVHTVSFDGSKLTSGIYIYQISAEGIDGKNFIDTKKMILLK